MAKIFIKFNAAVIKELELTKNETTFGRKPGNDVVIDNPAISGFHGRIVKERDDFFVEDLNSTNGTFLNGQRIKRNPLRNKDQIGIAHHILEFASDSAAPAPPPPPAPEPKIPAAPPETKTPEAQPSAPAEQASNRAEQLEMLRQSLGIGSAPQKDPSPPPLPAAPEPPPPPEPEQGAPAVSIQIPAKPSPALQAEPAINPPVTEDILSEQTPQAPPQPIGTPGVMKIVAGGVNNQNEVKLKDLVTYIGTAEQAGIKIKGLLAPSLAAAISRRQEGYFLKAIKSGYIKVNGNPIQEQVFLENGSLIEAGSTNMVFYFAENKDTKDEEPGEKSL